MFGYGFRNQKLFFSSRWFHCAFSVILGSLDIRQFTGVLAAFYNHFAYNFGDNSLHFDGSKQKTREENIGLQRSKGKMSKKTDPYLIAILIVVVLLIVWALNQKS